MNTTHLDRNNALIDSYGKIKTFPKIRLLQNSMNTISTMCKVMCNIPGHAHMVDSLLQLLWSTISIPYLAQTMLFKKQNKTAYKKENTPAEITRTVLFFYIELNSTLYSATFVL